MKAGLEAYIQEINGIDDAAELRRRLVVQKRDLICYEDRESEYLRSQKEMSLLYRQQGDELKGARAEIEELKKKLGKYEAKDTLDRNQLFGRKTEKTNDLLNAPASVADDPLSEDGDGSAADAGKAAKQTIGSLETEKKKRKRQAGKHAKDLSSLPHRSVYDYDPEELDRQFGKGKWRIVSWHSSTRKEVIPSIVYAKTTYTPVVSVGLEHMLASAAPSKAPLLPGSDVSESLAAWIMDNKFVLGLPAYRMEAALKRHGIALSRQTMTNWINRFSHDRFAQVADHMGDILKASGSTQCDETTLLVIRDGRRAGRKSYMWVHITCENGTGHPVCVFTYEPDRSTRHLREFYDKYVGEIVCDAYSAYQTFENESGDAIIICGCWMHARRRWAEALRVRDISGLTTAEIEDLVEVKALRLIGDIYKENGKLHDLSADERLDMRRSRVRPKVEAYYSFLTSLDIDDPSLSEKAKDAIEYSLNQKKHLCRFLERGSVPMDNGACERRIRPFAIGRNNWMFCTSTAGAEASAIMYTLVETAKANEADTFFYLKYLLENTPSSPELKLGAKSLEKLMPWSGEYREYEKREKQEMLAVCLPPSEEEPTGKKLMRYPA